jgi:photosystem II stability/assembly factor-like uncharacterized protein
MPLQLLISLLVSSITPTSSLIAHAHVPHDNIYDIAVPLDLDPTKHWMFAGYQAISESHNGGTDWEMTGGIPLIDKINSAVLLDDGTTIFLADRRLWWTQDEGRSYDYIEFDEVARDLESIGNNIAVLTDSGLQFGTLDAFIGKDDMTFSSNINANNMKASDLGISIVSESGSTWSIPADFPSLVILAPNPEAITATSSVIGGTKKSPTTYVGDSEGRVWKQSNTVWSQCGTLPKSPHPAVVELEVDGTRVFAAPASSAPFLSTDDCASWEDHRTPNETEFDNSGGAQSDESAFTVLRVRGDTWLIGGWDGLWLSRNNGVDWDEIAVIPPDFTRGIAFSQNFPSNRTVYIGAYAAGIQITNDGGTSFTSPNWGISQTNVQNIRTTKGAPNQVSAIAAHFAHVSNDGGHNWLKLNDPFPMDREVISYVEPNELWVFGKQLSLDDFDGRVAYSLDGGDTFLEPKALNTVMPSDPEYIVRYNDALDMPTYMATGNDGIFISNSIGGPWTSVLSELVGPSGGGGPALWPSDAPERAMIAKGGSVYLSFDGGLTWSDPHVLDSLDEIAKTLFASDGTAFAVTTAGRLFRSDTGKVWTEVVTDSVYTHQHYATLPAQVYEAQTRPDFEEYREILIGTHDGVYVVTDSEKPSISRWSGWQIVDNKADFVHCHGCPDGLTEPNNEPYAEANFGGISRISKGIEMSLQLRGHMIKLSGVIIESSQADVYVDGIWVGSIGENISPNPTIIQPLITIEDLDDGWHHVAVIGVAGEGVLIDTFASLTNAPILQGLLGTGNTTETGSTGTTDTADSGPYDTDSAPANPSDCGCASSTPHFLWLGLMAPLLLKRRHKT